MGLLSMFKKDGPGELLKKATSQKKDDIDEAIDSLRRAYKAISGSGKYLNGQRRGVH